MKRRLKLSSNAAIGGVCGGIAEYFENDPVLIRIAFCLFFMVAPLPTFFAYMLLAACMCEY